MSIEAIKWAFDFEAKNSSEKAVLLALANYAGGDGRCYPGQESIAKKASCTDRTVRAVLADLESRGVITRERRVRKDGSRTSDVIVLVPLSNQPENSSGSVEPNRKITSSLPENSSGLTTFEPSVEPSDNYSTARTRADAGDLDRLSQRLCDAADGKMTTHSALVVGPIIEMIAQGVDLETDILPAIRAKAATLSRPVDLKYFLGPIRDAYEARIASGRGLSRPKPVGKAKGWVEGITDDEARAKWVKTLNFARPRDTWKTWLWGPPPGHAGCLVPSDLLEPRDLTRQWFEEKQPEAA